MSDADETRNNPQTPEFTEPQPKPAQPSDTPPGDGNSAYGNLDASESDADFDAEETDDTKE